MSCKGKTGKEYTKCMRNYKYSFQRAFPNFNQKTDTVVYTGGKSVGEISKPHSRKINNVGGKLLKNESFYYPVGGNKWHSRSLIRKPNKKETMETPLYKKMSCWEGYEPKGKKKSPSGKKTASGEIKKVNNCVKVKK